MATANKSPPRQNRYNAIGVATRAVSILVFRQTPPTLRSSGRQTGAHAVDMQKSPAGNVVA